nr:uncharacterized protein LOC121503245 [Drosophila kikkawai]
MSTPETPQFSSPNRVTFFKRRANAIAAHAQKIASGLTADRVKAVPEEELTLKLELINKTEASFSLAHDSLEELDYEEIGSKARDDFEDLVFSMRSVVLQELGKRKFQGVPCSTMHPEVAMEAAAPAPRRSCLPELKLPTFSGGYTEYADFISMFLTIIDRNSDLAPIEKLQHLKSCLKGPALDAVRSLEITDSNYGVALELLDNRFNNKRLIFQAHITDIFGLSKVESASAVKLRELSDKLNANLRALQSLGTLEEIAGCILVHTLLQKVDPTTQAKWEESASLDKIPTCAEFTKFLEKRCQKLENVEHAALSNGGNSQASRPRRFSSHGRSSFVATSITASTRLCVMCQGANHGIYNCAQFSSLSPQARLREAKRLALCLNCLKSGHQLRNCSSGSCRACGSKHHSLLHFPAPPVTAPPQPAPPNVPSSSNAVPNVSSNFSLASSSSQSAALVAQNLDTDCVLLATAVISVQNRSGSWVPCRALLDSGSQLHIITSRLAHSLQLPKVKSTATVSGLGDSKFCSDGFSVNITLKSQASDFVSSISALVAPAITDDQPSFTVSPEDSNIPSNIRLADPQFFRSQRIDLLIGASLFFELLCVGQIKLSDGLPLLQKTRLGWVVTGGGSAPRQSAALAVQATAGTLVGDDARLESVVRKFWEVENVGESGSQRTKEELDCEAHFNANFTRLPSGEYSVRLPTKHSVEILGDSYQQAYRRFVNLENKLDRHPHLKAQYSAFIREYLDLNHMSLVDLDSRNLCKFYLPHHCVIKEDSTTTKLRVVFDGSAKSSSGYSLNELLMAGPTLQPRLFNTLLQFRTFPVALTGDICKMYRCVRIAEPDSYLQCILWRDSRQEEIRVYRLDTVTYGTKPASFLSVRAMHQLAEDEKASFPLGAKILLRDFYVDDLITGGNSTQDVLEIMRQTTGLLERGNFKLRKWCSNDPALLQQIPEAERDSFLKFDDGSDITKTLGLAWDSSSDVLLFSTSPMKIIAKPTKRSVLSTIACFYDPLGLICPVITKAKIFLQKIWRKRLDWDESLPAALNSSWLSLSANICETQKLQFPRLALNPNNVIEVHGFSDASIDAYGGCIYVVSMEDDRRIAHLLCAKSRVAPLKTLTVPKLELSAAVLLAQLIQEVQQMGLFSCSYYCWSDSAVVLSWIRDESSRFQIFTANRISLIQSITIGMEWRYVPTSCNPADILSRGALPSELVASNLWAHGPDYLQKEKSQWPESCLAVKTLPDLKKIALVGISAAADVSLYCKFFNSWEKLKHVFGYIYKFRHRIRQPGLTSEHVRCGTQMLIRSIQRVHLNDEYHCLLRGRPIKASSSIASLSPIIDELGLLRVGGRLKNSALDYEARHPLILPRQHPVTRAIILHFHRRNLHSGPRSLLSSIRQQFWPIGGRKTVGSAVSKCIICFRAKPHVAGHIMADLPEDRVSASYAFQVTGLDFCGPFYHKSEVRNKAPIKCYVCIFICFSTKAVHLELVQDLSTSAFLSALRRFILIRGKPARIWSDNATNFVGAKNELADLKRLFLNASHQTAIDEFCLTDSIEWRFIPPRSPHFGGLWEAAVKTAKYHFYRSVGPAILPADDLRTLVCHIAAIINSRPLVSLSEHPGDLDVLTPAHFLGTAPLALFPEPDYTNLNLNRLDRWQKISFYQQLFWSRWKQEYLTLLQQRSKWRTQKTDVQLGDVVLVKDENLPSLKWPLARVVNLVAGSDNVARVAVLKTATGLINRAVAKLCVLPKQDEVESPCLPTGGECLVMQPAPGDPAAKQQQ